MRSHHTPGALLLCTLLLGCSSDDPPAGDAAVLDHGPDAPLSDARVVDGNPTADATGATIVEKVFVGRAASLPVMLDLLTAGKRQFVAYYNKDRYMTVASRTLGSTTWTYFVTPSKLPWDGHNYVVMELDSDNQLHVSGNMHGSKLNYYRTTKPLDITTLTRVPAMVGKDETRVTYPTFLKGPKGELVFHYRAGQSGDGVTIFNRYDTATKTWSRLLDKPLFGAPGMNAYPHGPVMLGGAYHVAWVWRNTPNSATNHDPSYARSVDLVNWTRADGTKIALPITTQNGDIVDPVPTNSGLENFNIKVGIDGKGRPIVSYHKWDAQGDTQLYNARFEGKAWKIHQTSSWKGRYVPGSSASGPRLFIQPVRVEPDGGLSQAFSHWKESPDRNTNWRLDGATLKPIGTYPYLKNVIRALVYGTVTSPYPGMRPASIIGRGDKPEHRMYFLHWEVVDTKGSSWPPPTDMHVYKIKL